MSKLKVLSVRVKAALVAALILLAILVFFAIRYWSASTPNWIDVGQGGPEKFEQFPYRLIELTGNKTIPRTHTDLNAFTMSLQQGRSIGAWVYLPVLDCYAPQVRSGMPTVMCQSSNNADVYIAANDNVREVLLSLKRQGKVAAVKGRARGLYVDTPVIWVIDPHLKAATTTN